MMNNIDEKLKKLQKNRKNPFLIPNGYFEDFPSKLQERILSENKEYTWVLRLFQYVKPQFALGFMIVVFAVVAITTTNLILNNRAESGVNLEYYTRIR